MSERSFGNLHAAIRMARRLNLFLLAETERIDLRRVRSGGSTTGSRARC
jgi:hypothetical protein